MWNLDTDAKFVAPIFPYPASRLLTRALNKVERRLSTHARLHPHSWMLPLHRAFRSADVVHYHIVHDGYFALGALPYLARLKPTVWTWHDPWIMTGHCIYPLGCDRWKTGCGNCPDLTLEFPMRRDRTRQEFDRKRRLVGRTQAEMVVASEWMLERAKQSPIANASNCRTIPFGLDLRKFAPRNLQQARERLGIRPDQTVVCIRATPNPFKGTREFVEAISMLDDDIRLCILAIEAKGYFGQFNGRHQIVEFGWVDDEGLLIDAYSASDFFVMPSKAEAFGLMATEAMACGRTVISFEGTSLPSVTHAPEIGLAVPMNDVSALSRAIAYLARNKGEAEARGKKARAWAELKYDIRVQAETMANLYRELAASKI